MIMFASILLSWGGREVCSLAQVDAMHGVGVLRESITL